MNTFRWISIAFWILMLGIWVTWYFKGRERPRLWKWFGVLLLGFLLQHLADFYADTALGWSLLLVSLVVMIGCSVPMVRDALATWREQTERVKHL